MLQLNPRRHIALACYLLVGVYVLVALYLLSGLTGPGRYYRTGVPAGSDFLRVWAGASLAHQGQPAQVYQPDALKKVETAVVGGDFSYSVPFHYPPSFLWLMLPLSRLNYLAALAVWLFLPLAAYLALLYKIYPDRLTVWLALASMATAQNLFYGQGAFLVCLLLGGGLLLLDGYPVLAGISLALLANYKPHLAVLIPLALLAGRRWRGLEAFAAAGVVLVLASAWALGLNTWLAFWHDMAVAQQELGQAILWDRMPTVFAAVSLWGGEGLPALGLQITAALFAALAVYLVWRSPAPLWLRGSVLVLGTLLLTPYAFNYDLALLLLPLAWTAREGLARSWGRLNYYLLVLLWLLPCLDLVSVQLARLHLAPVILAVFLVYLLSRAAGGILAARPITSG